MKAMLEKTVSRNGKMVRVISMNTQPLPPPPPPPTKEELAAQRAERRAEAIFEMRCLAAMYGPDAIQDQMDFEGRVRRRRRRR